MSAAAVLAASIFAAIVGIILLGPPLWARIMEQ
jgi:diacylglycerol kinase